ncbi:MAG TPA: alpha/beta fold hydrolase [Thermoanaerobaculia bacterium]|nr:alpha/beta fold hydrolase [Thermoanaerobaculia bacterium]
MTARPPTLALVVTLATAAVALPARSPSTRAEVACADLGFRAGSVATAPGVELHVRRGGSGRSTVVVPGDFLLFAALCPLATDHTLVFYDMRNRGRSSRVTEGRLLTLEADVADLEALRRHLEIEEMALVGYSYLGKMVAEYALGHPDRVTRIVQLGPVPMDPKRTLPPAQAEPSILEAPESRALRSQLRGLRAEGLHESDPQRYCEREWELTRRGLVSDPAAAERIPNRCHLPNEWPTRLAFHMQHHFLGSMASAVTTAAEAARLEMPALVIHGTQDRNAPFGGGREWAASLPNARLLALPGVAHAAFLELDLIPDLRAFLGGEWPAAAVTVTPAFDAQRAQLQAWDLVRAGLAAHAPRGLPASGELWARWQGVVRSRSQSRTSEPPFEPAFPITAETVVDRDGERMERTEELRWPRFATRHRTVVTGDDAFEVDLQTGVVRPTFRRPTEELVSAVRSIPALLLRDVLTTAPGSLRFEGVGALEGEAVTLVSALHRDQRLDLYFRGDLTLAATGRLVDEPMLGDAYELTRYHGLQELAGLVVPRSIERRLEGIGQARSTVDLEELSWVPYDAARYQRPPASPTTAGETVDASAGDEAGGTPSGGTTTIRELAPGVHLVTLANAPDYHSMIVERDDHLVLLEAPLGPEPMTGLLDEIAGRFPDKRLRWLVATHHHFDHSGGVPAIAASGATLVTTPGNAGFFRRAVTGPRTLAGEVDVELAAPPAEIVAVSEVWEIPGGKPTVRVVRAEPSDHVEEMLFVHLPESELVFQGDLLRFPLDDPPRASASSLARRIDALGLQVDRIVGVHGRAGSLSELRRAITRAP